MKFSILIANYNNGKYFEDCYKSILKQKYKNWEAIIVDDASTDNSVEIIRKIIQRDPRFLFFENSENQGVGFTKGKLIDLASGEICGYLDPDDAILPDAVQASVEIFKKKEKVVLTYSRLMKCDENLKHIQEFHSAMQVPNGDPFFFNCPIQIAPFVGFRKSTYLTCQQMDSDLKIAEDQDLYFKLYEKGKVYFIDQTDYLYRGHSGGISQNDNKAKSYDFWAQAIFRAMKRRGIISIKGKKVPEVYQNAEEIFDLLAYQNSLPHRFKKKLKIIFQSLFQF